MTKKQNGFPGQAARFRGQSLNCKNKGSIIRKMFRRGFQVTSAHTAALVGRKGHTPCISRWMSEEIEGMAINNNCKVGGLQRWVLCCFKGVHRGNQSLDFGLTV